MFFSGISDEAGVAIDTQIRAHQELGFTHLELRRVDSGEFAKVSDAEFESVAKKVRDAGMKISCFASPIANWARFITGNFQEDLDDLKRCAPRMKAVGCPFIRVMSWPNKGLSNDEWKAEAIRRMTELAAVAEQEGITLVLENCDGWAAQSPANMAAFLREIGSPALKVVYDTGNPVFHHQHPLEMYLAVKEHIAYVHIKDCYLDSMGRTRYTFPNEGIGFVRQTLADLLRSGYKGGVSIEPHVGAVVHTGEEISDADARYLSYVEYGRRLRQIVEELTAA